MPARSRVLLAGVLLVCVFTAGVVSITAHSTTLETVDSETQNASVPSESLLNGNTTYRVEVRANGDARWKINRSIQLENESHREAFETTAERFSSGEYSDVTLAAFERASAVASDETGRQMAIENVTHDSRTGSDTGSLSLSFTWTNFGHQQDRRLNVDDVFQTDERWFPELAEDEKLIITRPSGYQFNSASTNIQDGTLRWDGPYTFGTNEPYVSFDPVQTATTPEEGDGTTETDEGDGATGALLYALVGLVLLGSVATIAYAARRKDSPLFPFDEDDDTNTGAAAESEPDERPADTEDEGTADEPKPDEAGVDGAAASDPAADETDVDDEQPTATDEQPVPTELLSDEERVERLLEANGGRMRQANIVEETGWSNAKVSQLLSAMDEAGRIEKLRIGRENLISFPEDGPGDTDS